VIGSFLAWVLRQELPSRLEGHGQELEWVDVICDLERLQMVEVEREGKRFVLRGAVPGTCGKVFQAAGVAIPPTVQVEATAPEGGTARSATPRH
jgi:hypothetical protein